MAADHDHSRCFCSSPLLNPCTLLELVSWADQVLAATLARLIHVDDNVRIEELTDEWNENNQDHSFVLDPGHVQAIYALYTDEMQGRVKPKRVDAIHAFLGQILQYMENPFCTWSRILVDYVQLTIKLGGFTVDADRSLQRWDPKWPGFAALKSRDPDKGVVIGCPATMPGPPEWLVLQMLSDKPFMRDYLQKHRETLAGQLALIVMQGGKLQSINAENFGDTVRALLQSDHPATRTGFSEIIDDMLNSYTPHAQHIQRGRPEDN